jgi:hypothetical protein
MTELNPKKHYKDLPVITGRSLFLDTRGHQLPGK